MRAARLLTTIAVTGLVAAASGYIVENGEATAARIGASLQSPGMARASVLADVPALPRPPIATLQATPLPTTRGWTETAPPSMDLTALDRTRFASEPAPNCHSEIEAVATENGMIRVDLHAPCNINEPVNFRHAGLGFSEVIPGDGRLTIEIPALVSDAIVRAVMQDGARLEASVLVLDAAQFHRVALVWRGDGGLHIHAQEFGADLGTAGHVWAGAPGRADLGANSQGGYLSKLGNHDLANASRAEVYTFPANARSAQGVVRLSVRAEVRNTNCGSMVAAQTIQPDGYGGIVSSDLTLRLPECDRIGEQMVLNNILRDLKIARN